MKYLGVDLAAKFSAAVLLNEDGEVDSMVDSWGVDGREFARRVADLARDSAPDVVTFVEDLPYGISNQKQVKPPARTQGYVIMKFDDYQMLDTVRWLAPATWKRHFGLVLRGQTAAQKAASARDKAAEFGFVAPDLLERYSDDIPPQGPEHAKVRNAVRGALRKAMTDYDDAFLIARYLYEVSVAGADIDKIQGIQPT